MDQRFRISAQPAWGVFAVGTLRRPETSGAARGRASLSGRDERGTGRYALFRQGFVFVENGAPGMPAQFSPQEPSCFPYGRKLFSPPDPARTR